MRRRLLSILLAPGLLVLLHCNSLLSEVERIRKRYNYKNSEAPTVVATDPADGATGSATQTYIDLTFSTTLDPATASVQATSGTCSGSLQFSTDNFATCIGGSLDASANPRLRFSPTVMPRGAVIRIRALTQITNSYGKSAIEYNSPQGVSFSTLCGSSHCFFSTSLPLMSPAGSGTAMFLIRSGTHAGKLVIMTVGQTATTMIDFSALTSGPGPALPSAPTAGLHTFPVTQGPAAGAEMVLAGGTIAYFYDPTAHSFALAPSPAGVNAGAFSFIPVAGVHADRAITVNAQPSTTLNLYPDNLGNFGVYGNLPGPDLPGPGGHALRLSAGGAASYFFVVFGNGTQSSRFFEESTGNLLAGPTLAGNAGDGAGSFVVASGPLAGRIITVLGGNSNATNQYNISLTSNEGPGPTLTDTVGSGGQVLYRYGTALAVSPLMLHGGLKTTSSRFDSGSGSFIAGPLTHGAMGSGSAAYYIPSVANDGYFFLVNGALQTNTQVYDIRNLSFLGNTLPGSVPNPGAHAFYVSAGSHSGRTLIVAAGGSHHTALYDPTKHAFFQGPPTFNPITASGFSVPITRGAYTGRVVLFAGGGANTYNVYNPPDGTFKSMLDLGTIVTGVPLAVTTGANAFEMTDGRILIMNGGGVTTQILDQESYSFVTAGTPTAACLVNQAYNLRYTRPSDGRAMQLVWCSGSVFNVFDHVTQTFTLHSAAGGGAGLQAFVIPSGSERGNIALIHGGGTSDWSILSAEDLSTVGGLRSLAGCAPSGVAAGSQLIAITTGANAGRHLLVVGNNMRDTCLFDPATLSFSPGPLVSSVASPGYHITAGSVAFPTRGGAYPTATVLLSGATKNVFSTFVP